MNKQRLPFFLEHHEAHIISFVRQITLIVSIAISSNIIFDILNISIWRHDEFYYTDTYFANLKEEGRWINYILYHWLKSIPGWIGLVIIFSSFFVFSFLSAFRCLSHERHNATYVSLLSLLFLQIYPLYLQSLWPLTSMPAFLIMGFAAIICSRMDIWYFYLLFGALCFGSMSNVYYLLPLVHLHLLTGASSQGGAKAVTLRILSAWVVGFLFGYGFMLVVVFLLSGQWGIQLADWRRPHYVRSLADLWMNICSSAEYFIFHISIIFSNASRVIELIGTYVLLLFVADRQRLLLIFVVCLAIVMAHYILILSFGIQYQTRTALATWAGILAIVFFFPTPKQLQTLVLSPVVLLLMFSFAQQNKADLAWYTEITNSWRTELIGLSSFPPQYYKGIIMLSDDDDVKESVRILEAHLGLQRGIGYETLGRQISWRPAAMEAGFNKVTLCGNNKSDFCDRMRRRYSKPAMVRNRLYQINEILDEGLLLVALNTSHPYR